MKALFIGSVFGFLGYLALFVPIHIHSVQEEQVVTPEDVDPQYHRLEERLEEFDRAAQSIGKLERRVNDLELRIKVLEKKCEDHMRLKYARSTTKVVNINGVPHRIWEAVSSSGIRCFLFVASVMVHEDENHADFCKELEQQSEPSVAAEDIPLRLDY